MNRSVGELRLRVFAGPNGSGKSTIIKAIKNTKVNGHLVDLGIYINADDIAQRLLEGKFSFSRYHTHVSKSEILEFAHQSGLLDKSFSVAVLKTMFTMAGNSI